MARPMARPMSTGSPNWLAQLARPMSTGSPNEYWLAQLAQSSRGGRTAARFFLPVRPQLPGIEARPARHRSPAEPAPRSGFFPAKKMSRLSSKPTTSAKNFSSCPVDHCLKFRRTCPGHVLAEPGNSTRNSTRATPKKWDMPVSSSELHAGSNQKMVGACFQFQGTSATCAFEHHIPARHSLPGAPARHRSLHPAEPTPGNLT